MSYKSLCTYSTPGVSKTPKYYQHLTPVNCTQLPVKTLQSQTSNCKEKFGSFSIRAAVRPPYNIGYTDKCYKAPTVPGVN